MTRLTDDQLAQARWDAVHAPQGKAVWVDDLLAEVDALRAERDAARADHKDAVKWWLAAVAIGEAAVARAEQAEAERDEALTALGEHVIATEHDRDEYLAMQRLVAERDNEIEALHDAVDRIRGERNAAMARTECAETHGSSEVLPPRRALSGEEA